MMLGDVSSWDAAECRGSSSSRGMSQPGAEGGVAVCVHSSTLHTVTLHRMSTALLHQQINSASAVRQYFQVWNISSVAAVMLSGTPRGPYSLMNKPQSSLLRSSWPR